MNERDSGLERREFLQRSALVGGAAALAWAAPSVTSYGARAFASGTPPQELPEFSHLLILSREIGTEDYFRSKLENDETWTKPEGANQGIPQGGGCFGGRPFTENNGAEWDGATPVLGPDVELTVEPDPADPDNRILVCQTGTIYEMLWVGASVGSTCTWFPVTETCVSVLPG